MTGRPHLLLVDNYDSFTHILGHELEKVGANVDVVRHDAENLEKVSSAAYSGIVLSPGPGRPEESGISSVVVDRWTGKVPILGVCLGHQLLATKRGVAVVKGEPVHGRTGTLIHRGEGLFADLPSPLNVARYHSLRVDTSHWPAELRITATDAHDPTLVLAFDDASAGWHAVQFHPESHLTNRGSDILRRFVSLCR